MPEIKLQIQQTNGMYHDKGRVRYHCFLFVCVKGMALFITCLAAVYLYCMGVLSVLTAGWPGVKSHNAGVLAHLCGGSCTRCNLRKGGIGQEKHTAADIESVPD